MPYVCLNPEMHVGSVKGNGQCVAFVKECAHASQAGDWKRGALVRGNLQLTRGTAIATFDAAGHYPNHAHGNHAAIYDSQDGQQIWVYDQYKGVSVAKRSIRFRGGHFPNPSRDGDAFYVIE